MEVERENGYDCKQYPKTQRLIYMLIKAIILDFDGVIVESNNIKHQAFSELFSEYPEHHDDIMAYHLSHNAVNRHEKFQYIMENILYQNYDQKLAKEWAERFSEMTRTRIINCPYVPGAIEFLEYFSGKYNIYLASATPLDELEMILNGRGLSHYFKTVYGAPTMKIEMFRDIAKREMIKPDEILYIGDSYEDYKVANDFGCDFIARTSDYDFEGLKIKRFQNMIEIKTYILNNINGERISNGLFDRNVSA